MSCRREAVTRVVWKTSDGNTYCSYHDTVSETNRLCQILAAAGIKVRAEERTTPDGAPKTVYQEYEYE